MIYSSEKYIELFNKKYEDTREEQIESLRNKDVYLYRVKTIKSGDMLESEIYPLYKKSIHITRAKKEMESRDAQKNLNDKNAKKKIIRRINTNFTKEDLIIDLTYSGKAPNEEKAKKDIQNYIRRIKNYRKKNGLPKMKYVYVIEFKNEESKKTRIHHHMVMNDMDRDVAEKLWGKGYANCRRLQPNSFGLEGIARYITKDRSGTKRWCCSRNLKEPKITIADHKISRAAVMKLAKNQNSGATVFEKLYKNYIFNDMQVKYNDFIPGAYIYTRMRKT